MAAVWFITGVSSGLGNEIALQALSSGQRVIGTVRNRAKAARQISTIEDKGGKILKLNVTDAAACPTIFKKAENLYGQVDVLVNNAKYSLLGAVEDLGRVTSMSTLLFHLCSISAMLQFLFFANTYTAIQRRRSRKANKNELLRSSPSNPRSTARFPRPQNRYYRKHNQHSRNRRTPLMWALRSQQIRSRRYISQVYCKTHTNNSFFLSSLIGLSESLARETSPFNINVLLVEPSAFRTNFLPAIAQPNKPHTEDYQTVKAGKHSLKVIFFFSLSIPSALLLSSQYMISLL